MPLTTSASTLAHPPTRSADTDPTHRTTDRTVTELWRPEHLGASHMSARYDGLLYPQARVSYTNALQTRENAGSTA